MTAALTSDSSREARLQAAARAYEALHGNPVAEPVRAIRWKVSPRVAVTAGVVVLLVVVTAVLGARPDSGQVMDTAAGSDPAVGADGAGDVVAGISVTVHVSGAVVTPGVYVVEGGSRVADAVDAAGGALPDADTGAINLARRLTDGEHVVVPRAGEGSAASAAVNLNTADAGTLEALPGIGPVLATRIVSDRERNGPYAAVDDLDRVSGVGSAVLAQIRDLVTV